MNFNKLIESSGYDFLRKNESLNKRIILLTLGGSYAYGTAVDGISDVDIRGICLNSKADLLGMGNFDQFTDIDTDTVIFSFNKIITLLLNMNPNVCEILGCKPEHYLILSPIGQELLDNKKLFLSKRAAVSFGGYANQQLRRLQNALARDSYPQSEKEQHILGSVKSAITAFENRYKKMPEGSLSLAIDKSEQEDLETEIFVDVSLKHYPLRDYKNIWSDMQCIVKDYGKLNKRNNKKDDIHLAKHMMHLIRLYMMCIDILEKEEIITYREKEHKLLMDIRNGAFLKGDKVENGFYDLLDEYEKRLDYAKENTSLPESPDMGKINDFMISVNERAVRDEY